MLKGNKAQGYSIRIVFFTPRALYTSHLTPVVPYPACFHSSLSCFPSQAFESVVALPGDIWGSSSAFKACLHIASQLCFTPWGSGVD